MGEKRTLASLKRKPWALSWDSRNGRALIPPPEGSALCKQKAISVRGPELRVLLGCSIFKQPGTKGHTEGITVAVERVSGYILGWQQNLPVSSMWRWFVGIQNAKVRGQWSLAPWFHVTGGRQCWQGSPQGGLEESIVWSRQSESLHCSEDLFRLDRDAGSMRHHQGKQQARSEAGSEERTPVLQAVELWVGSTQRPVEIKWLWVPDAGRGDASLLFPCRVSACSGLGSLR